MDQVLKNIIEVMKDKKISQVELCEKLGLTKNNFSDWKANRSKSYNKYIFQIADILGTTPEYLKGETDQKEKAPQIVELSEDDMDFVEGFSSLSKENKDILRGMLRVMREQKEE